MHYKVKHHEDIGKALADQLKEGDTVEIANSYAEDGDYVNRCIYDVDLKDFNDDSDTGRVDMEVIYKAFKERLMKELKISEPPEVDKGGFVPH